jgi:hypothetical protein
MRDPVSTRAVARIVSEPPPRFFWRRQTFCGNFEGPGIYSTGHRSAAATNAVVGASDAGYGIKQDEHIFAAFNHAPAAFDHESGKAHVGFQVLIVGGGYDFGFHEIFENP